MITSNVVFAVKSISFVSGNTGFANSFNRLPARSFTPRTCNAVTCALPVPDEVKLTVLPSIVSAKVIATAVPS
ncbi:hypothetical protein [Sporosarcina sp. FA9]|uniref:hypothetical protein n=1 Tax=Sporosarcina sp. FA9 TaxID=3413030 RepID=UPI003F65C7DE